MYPRDAYAAWKRTAAFGFIALALLMVALVEAAKRMLSGGRLSWETPFLQRLGDSGPLGLSSAVFFQTFGTDITLAILIIFSTGIAVWMRRPITAWCIALAYAGLEPVIRFGWLLWDRSRPRVLFEGIAAPPFHSFPSGHTAKTLAVYGVLTFIWIRASRNVLEKCAAVLILAAISIVVPLGRMSMGVHWPSDIIAGWIIGLFWLCVLAWSLRFERTAAPS